MPVNLTFLQDGKIIKPEQAAKASVMVYDADGDPNVAQIFASEANFRAWAEKSKHAEKFARVDDLAERARAFEHKDNAAAQKRQVAVTKRLTAELEELAASTGLAVGSLELFRKATVDSDPLMGPIFDPSMIHQFPNAGGFFLPLQVGTSWPRLDWLNFDNRASSVTWMGVVALWPNQWFGGARLLLVSVTPNFVNLAPFGFNNRASSLIVY